MSTGQRFDHQDRGTWLSTRDRPNAPLQPIISPSILASDFARLLDECTDVLSAKGGACEWLHVDVMDGHFVPNISIGPCVVEALRRHLPHVFLDVHCMISAPEKWITEMAKAGASQMTFHIEAAADPCAVATSIQAAGMQSGVSIKPQTALSPTLYALLDKKLVDMVLIMTVEPGFGGQKFMSDMLIKVRELRHRYPHLNIQVDGGLNDVTVNAAAEAGANVIVAGTYIFKAQDRKSATDALRAAVQRHLSPTH